MLQRAVIRGIPLAALVMGIISGWLAVSLSEGWPAATDSGGYGVSPIFAPEVQRWAAQISGWAAAAQLDPNLVATVMQIESCGWSGAVSSSGAQGLFQVMPFHFAPWENGRDPDTNARRGLAYLALGLARSGGNVSLALAGYNGGHGRIGQEHSLWPEETRRYVYWGAGIYADAAAGRAASPRLVEWLAAGGASLCERAAQSGVWWR